jgi:general stress protein 26
MTGSTPASGDDIKKLWGMIKDIRVTMMTTVDDDGTLRSRPMVAQQSEFDGDLWFFTWIDSPKVDEVKEHHQVNLSYAEPDDQNYVSISGTAQIVRDKQKVQELWSEYLATWFPKGKDDPNIGLIRVKVTKAEYWDSPSSAMVHAYGYVKAKLTGEPPNPGDHKKISM